ncbi:hypothetical protein TCAL_16356 [Tigriopus californicus]|uniref:Nucleoporin Nup188 N-terminal subdomain III domain-containing protein n=1 Tax=Tigriopus californicus TaxID=6832 RepID=A0A553NZ98_TIGCA|nr:hypothetical protein TCAL_16356 [Tigriopus californicus]
MSATTTSSLKQLSRLVTEQGVLISDSVLSKELSDHRALIAQGLLAFPPPTSSSRAAFLQKWGGKLEKSGKLTQFLVHLSELIQVEEKETKNLLYTYLAGEFRGTKASLKKLIDDERYQGPLMNDIWQFYRAERLYLLQVIKEILCHSSNPGHPHQEQFQKEVDHWLEDDKFMKNLQAQLKSVIHESVPSIQTRGKYFNATNLQSWVHFSLREQAELVEIILLLATRYDQVQQTQARKELFCKLYQLFLEHGFGSKQNFSHLINDVSEDLVQAIGQLEALIMVYLIDLPSLTDHEGDTQSTQWQVSDFTEVEKLITSLGGSPCHGPIMIGWMLARFLVDGESSLAKYQYLGSRAVQLRVVHQLERILKNPVIVSNTTMRGIANGVCYSIVSALVSAFEPARMGLSTDIHSLALVLLKNEAVALDFWRQGSELGLGTHFTQLASSFPASLKPFCDLAEKIAGASEKSSEYVLDYLENMQQFCEPVESVSSQHIKARDTETWVSLMHRFPCGEDVDVKIPAGTIGILDGSTFKWRGQYNAWNYLFAEVDRLIKQISSGMSKIHSETLSNVTIITKLIRTIVKASPKVWSQIGLRAEKSLICLTEKVVQINNPPLELLTYCMETFAFLCQRNPVRIWQKLEEFSVFPHQLKSGLGESQSVEDINSGVIGHLLAQQECVNGEFPLTLAYLELLAVCLQSPEINATPSLVFVAQDLIPSFSNWRFSEPGDREIFGQKLLCLTKMVLESDSPHLKELNGLVCALLLKPAPLETMLNLIQTGDRMVQSLIEAQSSWEAGAGVELSALIDLAMLAFNALLIKAPDRALQDLSAHLCAPALGNRLHFSLTLAHYIYHLQSCDIPISAMKLLGTIARTFPMSLLACFGNDADAVKEILIYRLESQTEDIKLKISILDLFSDCVETQPGFIQHLIGQGQDNETGCLTLVVDLLKRMRQTEMKSKQDLHIAVITFIFRLWNQQMLSAVEHLKKQPSFWDDLTWILFETDQSGDNSNAKINATIFRVISAEIFAFGAKVDDGLKAVLEKLVAKNSNVLEQWCDCVLDGLPALNHQEMIVNDTFMPSSATSPSANNSATMDLLGAWKTFLIVFSNDQPVTLTPSQCHLIASKFIQAIRAQLDHNELNLRIITSLSEVCLVLMQKWQTKCADNMEAWMAKHAALLEHMSGKFDQLHPRSQSAVLAIASTALKTSSFKLERGEKSLLSWLEPTASITLKSLQMFELNQSKKGLEPHKELAHVPVLAVSLLRNLIHRLDDPSLWFDLFHKQVILQALLSQVHHCLHRQRDTNVILALLGLLSVMAKSEQGCQALLSSDLAQMIWLPLSEVKQANNEWVPVFQISLQFLVTLIRVGEHRAVENGVTVVTLLQEQLSTFLMAPNLSIQEEHIELTVTATSVISLLMNHYKQWHLLHSPSLVHFYQSVCSLLHTSICLLIRPSLLGMLIHRHNHGINASTQDDEDLRRVRRISSTDQDIEPPSNHQTVAIQNLLLECICGGLTMLRALCPDLVALLSDNVEDYGEWEQLLGIGFSSPTFEQNDGLTFGTLISISNLCIRNITRVDRSPSPSRGSPSSTGESQLDRKRVIIILEQSMSVMVSQALLFLSDPRHSSRDQQLVRRELGAELGSFTESIRRYVHRGAKSPQSGDKSPGGKTSGGGDGHLRLSKSDEDFMKFIATIVNTVFK